MKRELEETQKDLELKWEWLQERLDAILDIAAAPEGEDKAFAEWKNKRAKLERRRTLPQPGLIDKASLPRVEP